MGRREKTRYGRRYAMCSSKCRLKHSLYSLR